MVVPMIRVYVGVPQAFIDAIEAWATRNSVTRSDAIRRLVELGLKKGQR